MLPVSQFFIPSNEQGSRGSELLSLTMEIDVSIAISDCPGEAINDTLGDLPVQYCNQYINIHKGSHPLLRGYVNTFSLLLSIIQYMRRDGKCATVRLWPSENNLWKSVLSVHCGPQGLNSGYWAC